MNPRQHALLARRLIERCGGLDEAAKACRVGRSVLSQCQTTGSGAFMAADVMADLEAYCGEPLYSRALVENRPCMNMSTDLLKEACEVVEAAAELLRDTRAALKDGGLSEVEKDQLRKRVAEIVDQLRDVLGVLDARRAA